MRIKLNNVHKSSLQTSKTFTNAATLFMSSILNACLHLRIFVEDFLFHFESFFDTVQIRREAL